MHNRSTDFQTAIITARVFNRVCEKAVFWILCRGGCERLYAGSTSDDRFRSDPQEKTAINDTRDSVQSSGEHRRIVDGAAHAVGNQQTVIGNEITIIRSANGAGDPQ